MSTNSTNSTGKPIASPSKLVAAGATHQRVDPPKLVPGLVSKPMPKVMPKLMPLPRPSIRPVLPKPTPTPIITSNVSKVTVPAVSSSTKPRPISELLPAFILADDKLKFAAILPVDDLSNLVIALSDAYYNSDPLVEDRTFDDIQTVLKLVDPNNKALKMVGSSIRTAEQNSTKDDDEFEKFKVEDYPEISKRGKIFTNPNYRVKCQLPFLMPSMDKIKPNDINEYASWLGKTNAVTKGMYNISDKLDGMSVALIYTLEPNGTIKTQLFSRGDGQIGEDLSAIIPYLDLPDIPKEILEANGGHLFIRGEMLISKKTFMKELGEGKGQMAMRNIARGIMARKTLQTAFLNLLDLVVYELVSPWNSQSITEALDLLTNLGFNVVPNQLVNKALTLEELRQLLIKRKTDSKYELDGLIISQDKVPKRDLKPGDKYPSYAIAFKFDSDSDDIESALTKVLFVTWGKSKDGKLNPVATIKPVGLGGTKVEHVTVHNARHVIDMGIGPGAIIRIVKGGDVIPHIAASLRPVEPSMPTDIPYEWNETNKAISIIGADEDEDVLQSRVEFFFKKIDVPGWGPSTIEKIFKHIGSQGIAYAQSGIHEILDMNVADFQAIPGYQGKTSSNLYNNLRQKLSNVNITTFMAASNIFGPGWGERRFQSILDAIPDLLEEPFRTKEDRDRLLRKIMDVQGFQRKTGEPLMEGLAPFIAFLYGIYRLGWVGIFRLNPLPEPYILPSENGKYRNDSKLDEIWDDLQAIGYSSKDYTDKDYENASLLQKAMFDRINDSLSIREAEIEAEEAEREKAMHLEEARTRAATSNSSMNRPQIVGKLPLMIPRGRVISTPIAAAKATVTASTATTSVPKVTLVSKPSLFGKTVVFTGVHKGLEDQVSMLGGKVSGSVSGNTDLLVIKDANFSSAKVVKAKDIGTTIMTADDFKKMYL